MIALSALFLGERMSLRQLGGVVLVLAGVGLVTWVREAPADAHRLRRGVAQAALSVFLMAVAVVIAKPLLGRYDFLWVVELRIAGGMLGLAVIAALRRQGAELRAAYRGVRHWPQVIAGSAMGTYVSMMLWLAGYKYTQASIAAVLNELAAIFILILAALFLHERVTPRQAAGVLLALAGVVLVVFRH